MRTTATTTQPTLALRRQSIRTLTPSELSVARGGGASTNNGKISDHPHPTTLAAR
jgi:hypothetical protein